MNLDKTASAQNKPTGNFKSTGIESSFEAEMKQDKAQVNSVNTFLKHNQSR